MKTKTFLFILPCLHLLLITSVTKAQKVLVDLYQPPPNEWHIEDLWNLTLKNLTPNENLTVYLHGTVKEADDGLIIEGTSAIFDLAPNFLGRIVRSDLEPAEAAYANSEYEEMVLSTGTMPAGTYQICITVIDANSLEVLGEECIDQIITHPSPPDLLTPLNETEVDVPMPVFLWLPQSPLGSGEFVTYTIKIVELLDGQVPIEAMDANLAFYTEQGISSTSFQLPVSANGFEPDNNYAWQVTANENNYEIGKSQVWSFSYLTSVAAPALNCETTFCKPENWVFGTPAFSMNFSLTNPAFDNNTLYLTQPLQINPYRIAILKAELINFEWLVADSCKKCDLNFRYWGRLTSGNVNDADFNSPGLPPNDMADQEVQYSHSLSWNPVNAADSAFFNGNVVLVISLPPQTQKTACKDTLRFCVRFSCAYIHAGNRIFCSTIRCYYTVRDHVALFPAITLPGQEGIAQIGGVVPDGITPPGTPPVCVVSASQKNSYLKINRHPGYTSLSDTILLNGNSLYKEVRVNLVSLILTGKDTTGQIKDSCLPCYRVPQWMASITGGGLNEFNAVVSNYPGSLPAKPEHNPMELVFTTLSPKSFTTEPLVLQFSLPGASASSKCHVIADLFLQITFRDINCLECIIPLTISFDLYSGELIYAELKEQLDGSYYPAIHGKLCFKYTERYAVPEGKILNYSIYNKRRQLVTNQAQPNPGMPALHIASGTNFLDLDLSKVSDMTAGEFYVLEVLSDKKDKYYLRFKFLN